MAFFVAFAAVGLPGFVEVGAEGDGDYVVALGDS